MRKTGIMAILVAAGMSVGGCATNDRYGYGYDDGYYGNDRNNRQAGRAAAGAAVGGAIGAGVGAVVGGVSPVEGAIVGALGGAVVGAATSDQNRRWYRDERGDCFYVNSRGERIYDYNARC